MTKSKKGHGVGQTIGSVLVGFDHQVFRTTLPPHELVQKGTRLPAVPAEDGGTLSIELPNDPAGSPDELVVGGDLVEGPQELRVGD